MFRFAISALLPAALLLATASPGEAQWRGLPNRERSIRPGDLAGIYVNTSNSGICEVRRQGRDYMFINENGTPAQFTFIGPNRLQMVWGGWNPFTTVTVSQDIRGWPLLQFQEPGKAPGFWVIQQ